MLLLGGCSDGPSADVIEGRQAAEAALTAGNQAFEAGNFDAALAELSKAVESGFLNADLYSGGAVKLAVVQAAKGDFAAADALLDDLERGAPNMDEVLAARSFVLRKLGKRNEAKAAWVEARRINPAVKEF